MNIELSYLIGPLTGSAIGYFTNWLAIKMMLHPYEPKYIFGMRIPFTPGLVPKERGRIAEAVGSSISENLMNKELLEKNLLSEDMLTKIGEGYDTFIAKQRVNTETLRAFLGHFLSAEDLRKMQADAGGELAAQIHSRLADSNLGTMLAHAAVEHAINSPRYFPPSISVASSVTASMRWKIITAPAGFASGIYSLAWSLTWRHYWRC